MTCLVTMSTYTVNEDFAAADRIVSDLESGGAHTRTQCTIYPHRAPLSPRWTVHC